MWLINCGTLKLEFFVDETTAPAYAILSHTWGSDELSFREMKDADGAFAKSIYGEREGWKKIDLCCREARVHDLKYAWVDTCCIDKSSSAELSEAINSMFRWYKNSTVAFAYLADVPDDVDATDTESGFVKSRWFKRGWTLQELLAPKHLLFFSTNWCLLGERNTLVEIIQYVTKIDQKSLMTGHFDHASIAQRMAWAADRKTTRAEDKAYCLLGIFDIQMALLYGERERAFARLQEAIAKIYDDQSLYTWGITKELRPIEGQWANEKDLLGDLPNAATFAQAAVHSWGAGETTSGGESSSDYPFDLWKSTPFLASSPEDFKNCADVHYKKDAFGAGFDILKIGRASVSITLPRVLLGVERQKVTFKWISYWKGDFDERLFIVPLGTRYHRFYTHVLALILSSVPSVDSNEFQRIGRPILLPFNIEFTQGSAVRNYLVPLNISQRPTGEMLELPNKLILLKIPPSKKYRLSDIRTAQGWAFDRERNLLFQRSRNLSPPNTRPVPIAAVTLQHLKKDLTVSFLIVELEFDGMGDTLDIRPLRRRDGSVTVKDVDAELFDSLETASLTLEKWMEAYDLEHISPNPDSSLSMRSFEWYKEDDRIPIGIDVYYLGEQQFPWRVSITFEGPEYQEWLGSQKKGSTLESVEVKKPLSTRLSRPKRIF